VNAFHFLRPAWFLALIPLFAGLWWAWRGRAAGSPWRRLLDPALQPAMLVGGGPEGRPPRALGLLALAWLVAVTALAGPAWERRPRPAFAPRDALVVVFDLSRSMLAADLRPSRLERARYKVRALLRRRKSGLTGLVAFAGDAFVVTPLTDDTRTLAAHLGALSPDLMPVQGSRVDRGLERALDLLRRGNAVQGGVLLVTDGYRGDEALAAARHLAAAGFRLGVLGVGTPQGAPIPAPGGGQVRDVRGRVVLARLDRRALERLAEAGDGRYADLTPDDTDLHRLAPLWRFKVAAPGQGRRRQAEEWIDRGPWLLPLLLPLAALGFRRGWLLGLILAAPLGLTPGPARALTWHDLWETPEQQAQRALEQGRARQAAALARDPLRRGAALYREGRYRQAAEALKQARGADAAYDLGNALARLGRYKEAVAAYDRALKQRPGMADALENKALLQRLLRDRERRRPPPKPGRRGGKGSEPRSQQARSGGQGGGKSTPKPARNGGQEGGASKSKPARNGGREGGASKSKPARNGGRESGNAQPKSGPNDAQGSGGSSSGQARAGTGKAAQAGTGQSRTAPRAPAAGAEGADRKAQRAPAKSGRSETKRKAGEHPSTDRGHAAGTGEPGKAGRKGNVFAKGLKDLARSPGTDGGQAASAPRGPAGKAAASAGPLDPLSAEERQAAEQWLRRIPDDPGGLLRRKFLYQYRARARRRAPAQPW